MTNFEFYKYEHFSWFNYPLALKDCSFCPMWLASCCRITEDGYEKDSKECLEGFNDWASSNINICHVRCNDEIDRENPY